MKDSWCKPVLAQTGNRVSGGAARNVRIAAMGGMDEIIADVVKSTLDRADNAVRRTNLRVVSSKKAA